MAATAQGIPLQFSASTDVNSFFVPVSTGITDPDNIPLTAFQIKTVPQKSLLFNITGSISGLNVGFGGATSTSGSVQLLKASNPQPSRNFIRETDYTVLGSSVFIKQTGASITNGSGQFNFSATSSVEFNDLLYLRVIGFTNTITTRDPSTFTASLHSFQITSEPTGSAKELVVEPYFNSIFYGTDCDVTYGNASQPVSNPFLQDIDYGKGTITPVNNAALISESATRGTVPESYYTSLAQTNIRYNGSKIQSSDVNVFNPLARGTDFGDPTNIGTYGQTPSISLNQSLVAYVDYIKDATPMINGKSIANIKYLINENGDAVSPNLSQITVRDVQNNFEDNKEINVSLIEPPEGTGMQILNGVKTIIRGGYRVEPILYTQTLSGKIALTSPSTGIPMETSSLTPVLDVRSENTDTATPSYYPNGGVGHIYQFNQENATLPGKAYYNHTTGKYTVNSSVANSGVTLIFSTQLRGGVGGFITAASTGSPGNVRIQIIHDKTANGGGLTVIGDNDGFWTPIYFDNNSNFAGGEENSSLVTGTVASGQYALNDTFYVKINVNFFQQLSFLLPLDLQDPNNPSFQFSYFNVGSIPSPTGIEPITGSIWGISGSSPSSTITSSNTNLLLSYGILKQDFITGSGMDETQQVFTIQPGDEFKFEDNESKTYTVKSVIEPSQDINNNLIVTLDEAISPSAVDLNYFLIRRFAPDGASIIFDELKPGLNPSGPAFIKPKFTTNILDKDIDQFIQNLKSKNLLT